MGLPVQHNDRYGGYLHILLFCLLFVFRKAFRVGILGGNTFASYYFTISASAHCICLQYLITVCFITVDRLIFFGWILVLGRQNPRWKCVIFTRVG